MSASHGQPVLRCAIHARQWVARGGRVLTSCDAQRERCEDDVRVVQYEGWVALDERFDDLGVSGGSLERPALWRLLSGCAQGRVDVVVVTSLDRPPDGAPPRPPPRFVPLVVERVPRPVAVVTPISTSSVGVARPHVRHASMTRFAPRHQTSMAPVRWHTPGSTRKTASKPPAAPLEAGPRTERSEQRQPRRRPARNGVVERQT